MARFWASRAEWNKAAGRFEFHDVIGPDENHDHVDNNAYTNAFARWTLLTARRAAGLARTNATRRPPPITASASAWMKPNWPAGSSSPSKIYFAYDPQTGLIEQFEGYFQRRDVDLPAHGAAHRIGPGASSASRAPAWSR